MTTEIAESFACWRCGKLVRVSGSLEHLTGFLENVAPHAASGGTMKPVHWACSTKCSARTMDNHEKTFSLPADEFDRIFEDGIPIDRGACSLKETCEADARDAARWRKFNEVAKKHFNREQGRMEFYLPRLRGGYKSLEQALDEDYAAVPLYQDAPCPAGVRAALLVLLNHTEPGWDNCRAVVQMWLDGLLNPAESNAAPISYVKCSQCGHETDTRNFWCIGCGNAVAAP